MIEQARVNEELERVGVDPRRARKNGRALKYPKGPQRDYTGPAGDEAPK
jgi:hypothetical protein